MMFTYRCPACGKQHVVDTSFVNAFDAPCLRCREIVHVTEEIIYAADGTALASASLAAGRAGLAERVQPAIGRSRGGVEEGSEDGSAHKNVNDPGAVEKGHDADWANQEGKTKDSASDAAKEPDSKAKNGKKQSSKDKLQPPSPTQIGRRRWLQITTAAVLIVGVLGAGGYFGYDFYRKNKTKQTAERTETPKTKTTSASTKTVAAASKTGPKTAAKTAPAAEAKGTTKGPAVTAKAGNAKDKAPVKWEDMEPILKPRDDKAIRLSAARLSAELATDSAATNEKYKGALLEVSGLYDRTDIRETVRPPNRPHVLFILEGTPIVCDLLGGHTPLEQWRALRKERPCTVRGTYGSDGVLHGCDLVPLTPPADILYKGKELEVTGYAAQVTGTDPSNVYPRVILENETHGLTIIECFFRKDEEEKVRAVAVETPVIIHGVCGGRFYDRLNNRYALRLDNCQFVYSSAAPAGHMRLEAAELLRPYEEDLRPILLPSPATGPHLESPVSLTQLETEFEADPKSLQAKYRHKTFAVAGVLSRRDEVGATVEVTTGNTDARVVVRCRFNRRIIKDLDKGPNYVIEGFCSGMADPRTLVLENCEQTDSSGRRDPRRLTADYLPHTPGRDLTYDVGQLARQDGRMQVARMLFEEKEGGLVETVTTHVGILRNGSLFDPAEREGKWINSAVARKAKLPGPKYRHRIIGGFVEIGHYEPVKDGQATQLQFEPALKVGARAGATWQRSQADRTHEYKLIKFDSYQGQPSAVIHESIAAGKDPHHPIEIEHIYVKGVGEVEHHEYQRLTAKERRIIGERRLLDEPRP
jgi:hypothetical protein